MEMPDKGAVHIPGEMERDGTRLGEMERDGTRFPHATQNSMTFKPYEVFTSGISYLIFQD